MRSGYCKGLTAVFALEDLLNPDDIALEILNTLRMMGKAPRREILFAVSLATSHGSPSDCVSGDLKDLADLPDLDSSLIKAQDGLLLSCVIHRDQTS